MGPRHRWEALAEEWAGPLDDFAARAAALAGSAAAAAIGAEARQAVADLIAWAFYAVVLGTALRSSSPWGRFRVGSRGRRAARVLPFWTPEVSDAVAPRRAAERAGGIYRRRRRALLD